MNKENLLKEIEHVFGLEKGYYPYNRLPSTISYAIYSYGSNDIRDIICFVDLSDGLDGSQGIIFSDEGIYFDLNVQGQFKYKDITSLKLQKDHNLYTGYINNIKVTHKYIQGNMFMQLLSYITDINIEADMNEYEKIAYFSTCILDDLYNEQYEDVILTDEQKDKVQHFYNELDRIHQYINNDYYIGLETLCPEMVLFFDDLGLDSEEMDELYVVYENMTKKQDEAFGQAKEYYDKMMNDYRNGDKSMFDKMKQTMNMLGIKEEDFYGKSPSEVEDMLCQKLGITKEQFEMIKKKLGL